MITIRLYDAVPEMLINAWKKELSWAEKLPASDPRQVELRKRIEKYEDAGYGSCWCIMPNHVHFVIEIVEGYPLDEVLHSLKSFTAHKADKRLRRRGAFWQPEYYDRCIRDTEHLHAAVEYVENNPVKARLAKTKKEWKWSSARRRQQHR